MKNKVNLLGHTGGEIQIHAFENGDKIGILSLATNHSYKNKKGEKVQQTEWHRLVFRNKACDIIDQYCEKGDKLDIEGRITYRSYTTDDGQEKFLTEIVVSDFTLLS